MVALILEVYMSMFIRGSKFSAPGILTIITTSPCPILYRENICLQTFLLLFICPTTGTKDHLFRQPPRFRLEVQVGGSDKRWKEVALLFLICQGSNKKFGNYNILWLKFDQNVLDNEGDLNFLIFFYSPLSDLLLPLVPKLMCKHFLCRNLASYLSAFSLLYTINVIIMQM